jgi:outer membrane protein
VKPLEPLRASPREFGASPCWYGPCFGSRAMRAIASAAALLVAAASEAAPPQTMTLDEALAYARAHQPSLRAAQERAQGALSDAQVPRARWYPRAGATAQLIGGSNNNSSDSYIATYGVDVPRIGGSPATATGTWQPYASSFIGIGLRQEVFDFGRIAAESAVFDSTAAAEAFSAKSQALDLDLAVRDAYFAVKAAKSVQAAAQAAYDRVKANRDLAAAGVKSGLRAPIELTRADADLMRLDVGRIRALGSVETSQAVFAAVVGVAQPLLDAGGEVPAVPPPPPLESAVPDALSREPAVLEAGARLSSQEANTRAILSELRPDLQFTSLLSGRAGGAPVGVGAVPNGSGFLPDIPNWDVGLALSWQWFDGTVLARMRASEQYEKARREELESVKLRTSSGVQQAYVALDVAEHAMPALQRSVDAAQANYAQADARFHAGLGTSVELADAEAVRTEAEIQLALGQFDYSRARALVTRAIAEAP